MKRLTGYQAVIGQANLSIAKRRPMPIGRGGKKVIVRKFHLSKTEIDDLLKVAESGDKFPNPHNKGNYFFIVESLKALGLDHKHPLASVANKVKELMSDSSTKDEAGHTAWQRFRDKASNAKNKDDALDAVDRITQNIRVLQRINQATYTPYGLKIFQVGKHVLKTSGAVLQIFKAKDGDVTVMLNTDSTDPIDETKRVRVAKPKVAKAKVAKVAKPKAKVARKSRKTVKVETATEPAEVETPAEEPAEVEAQEPALA